jgi:hypothetical protein
MYLLCVQLAKLKDNVWTFKLKHKVSTSTSSLIYGLANDPMNDIIINKDSILVRQYINKIKF